MATLYKRNDSPYWWCWFKAANGRTAKRSTEIRTAGGKRAEETAQALANKWESDAFQLRQWGKEPDHSDVKVKELIAIYIDEVSRPTKARSGRADIPPAKRMVAEFGNRSVGDVTPADIRRYANRRKVQKAAANTINKELSILRLSCKHARDVHGMNINHPAEGIYLKKPEGVVRWLTHEEAGRLVTEAEKNTWAPYLADVIKLALNTGMRRREILELEIKRIDMQRGYVYLDTKDTKTQKRRAVPLNDVARKAILSRLNFRAEHSPDSRFLVIRRNGKPIDQFDRSWWRTLDKAEIENFRFHDLRHTFASWLVMDGESLYVVKDLLGHKSIASTEIYAHLAPENLRSAVDRLVTKPLQSEKTGAKING